MMSDLMSGNNAFKQDAERRRGGIVTNFNDFIRKEALDRAARAAEKAGSLGYGKSPVVPGTKDPGNPKKIAKPKPKAKPKGKRKSPIRTGNKPRPMSAAQRRNAAKRRAAASAKKKGKNAAKKKAAPKKKGGSPVRYIHTKPKSFKSKGIRRKAKKIVRGDLNQLIKGITNDMGGIRRDRDYGNAKSEALYDRTKGDLEYIRGEVTDTVGANNAKIDAQYEATGSKMRDLQQALKSELGANSAANKDAAMAELARLGIEQTGTGRFDADASFSQALADQSGANQNANLDAAQAMSADVGAMLQSMNEGQFQAGMGQAMNTRNSAISDLTQTSNEALMDLRGDISEARAGRGSAVAKLYEQMRESRFNQWATTREMNFNQKLSAMQYNQSEAQRRKDNAVAAAARRRAAQSGGGGGGGGGGGTSYSSSGSGARSYSTPSYSPKSSPTRKPNPIQKLIPKKSKKLKGYGGHGYSPSGKFLDLR
jgi:hypothetical protein